MPSSGGESSATRRGLRLDGGFAPRVLPRAVLDMVELPGERLCLAFTEEPMRIVNQQMETLHTFEFEAYRLAAGPDLLYASTGGGSVCSVQFHDYAQIAARQLGDGGIYEI